MTCKLMWSISWRRAIIQPCTSITCAPGLIFLHQVVYCPVRPVSGV